MKKSTTAKEVIEWIVCIIIALVLALLVRYYVGTPTIVQQPSMYPTLKQNQRLILNRLSRTFKETPKRGDIITFESPSVLNATKTTAAYENEPKDIFSKFVYYVLEINKTSFIKRTIGLPGEHVKIENGKVYIDGKQLEESYLQPNVETQVTNLILADFIVPEGCVFAMGDNRTQSTDCRTFGCIPIEKIESKVWIRFWPFDLFGEVK